MTKATAHAQSVLDGRIEEARSLAEWHCFQSRAMGCNFGEAIHEVAKWASDVQAIA